MVKNFFKNIVDDYSNSSASAWRQLYRSSRTLPMPLTLELQEAETSVYCEEILRIIPGKRVVLSGTWHDEPVVVKLFFEARKASAHALRDREGIEKLNHANIPTPRLLFHGKDKHHGMQVLIFEKIMHAKSLDELWQQKNNTEEHTEVLRAVTLEIATQHVLGLVQRDLHFKNFLVTEDKIYTLDGGDIYKIDHPLTKKESLQHLALFFAQLGVGTEKLQKTLFHTYTHARGWVIKLQDAEFLNSTLKKHLKNRWEHYQKKITRNCSAFAKLEARNELILFDRSYQSDNFLQFLQNPEMILEQYGHQILKAGKSATVAKFSIDNRTLVLKRYHLKSHWHWLRRCFRPTRAASNWRLAHYLRLMGVSTAKPIAFIEKRFFGFRSHSYYVMEYIEGMHAGEFFANYSPENRKLEQNAEEIVSLLYNLSQLKLSHGDLKMTNILMSLKGPVLIDLDGMREHRSSARSRHAFKKEIKRFMKNWQQQPELYKMFGSLIEKWFSVVLLQ